MTELPQTGTYLVYCLASTTTPNQTYVGVTNNFPRRIRQHNGEIKGGAVRTRAYRPWRPFLQVRGLTKTQALQLEWAIKHRRKGGTGGPIGRIRTLEYLMGLPRWTEKADPISEIPLEICCNWTEENYKKLLPVKNRGKEKGGKEKGENEKDDEEPKGADQIKRTWDFQF